MRVQDEKNISMTIWLFLAVFALNNMLIFASTLAAAPSPELWPRWQGHSSVSSQVIDHSPWDMLLKKYLVIDHPSGINRFKYADVTPGDTRRLQEYLERLQNVLVGSLSRKEQKAYWINLYNAMTVKVVLDYYPVESIMDIDISPGFFSNGPWDAKLMQIEGEEVSLNDIEHRILRPIFNDNRLHYALNCASIGCPNLQPMAFTSANIGSLLESGARDYINSPRGVQVSNGRVTVSKIYKWFRVDFGGTHEGVIRHLLQYAQGGLIETLEDYRKSFRYKYDWSLNQP